MPSLVNVSIVPPNDLIDVVCPSMVPLFINVFTLAFICIPSLDRMSVAAIKPLLTKVFIVERTFTPILLPSIVPVLLKFSILVP